MIFSAIIPLKINAATSDVYDMSSWIDIEEFTLPSNITPETHNIIIYERTGNGGYTLLPWDKTADIYPRIPHADSIFPNSDIWFNDWNISKWANVSYYHETIAYSKQFKSTRTDVGAIFQPLKIVYSNVNIYGPESKHISLWFDLSQVNFGPTSYEFNENIDVTDISKIKVNFELPEDTSNLNLELDYSVKVLGDFYYEGYIGEPHIILKSLDENNNTLIDVVNNSYLDRDTIITNMCAIANCENFKTDSFNEMLTNISMDKVENFIYNSGAVPIDQRDNFRDLAQKLIDYDYCTSLYYFNTFNMSLLRDSTVYEYSLEIDTIDLDSTLNLNFISNLNYSIEYEYTVDNEDYYITVDMNDYSALVLVPKVYDIDNNISASFLSDIYLNGIYDIELWKDLESRTVLNRYDNYKSNVFSHYFHRDYNSSVLYFVNKDINSANSYIKFDSRYYSYALKKYLNEEVIITNPNTGEDMNIPDISDLYKYESDVDSRFSFNSFLKPIKFVFESITNFYNNYCPDVVQYFLYLIFSFFVILTLIKIFL